MDMTMYIIIAIHAGLVTLGIIMGYSMARREWQKEIVSRGYGEWIPSKEDPTRNVFAWKDNKKEN